jgi:hypothetical protein
MHATCPVFLISLDLIILIPANILVFFIFKVPKVQGSIPAFATNITENEDKQKSAKSHDDQSTC